MSSSESVSRVPGEGDDPVVIARYPNGAVARIDASLLIGAGVNADVQGELGGDALSYYGTAVRQVTLVVPSRQRDLAIQILKDAAQSRPAQRTEDWVCSECQEVSGPEFDSCWSCGKPWQESDREFVPELPDHLKVKEGSGPLELPPLDENPFAPPTMRSDAADLGSEATDDEIRRVWRGVILSFAFPPLLLFSTFRGAMALGRIGNGSLTATAKQRRKLTALTIFSAIAGIILSLMIARGAIELLHGVL